MSQVMPQVMSTVYRNFTGATVTLCQKEPLKETCHTTEARYNHASRHPVCAVQAEVQWALFNCYEPMTEARFANKVAAEMTIH